MTETTTSDEELVRRLRAGDRRAAEAIARGHHGRMVAVARRYLRSDEDRADAVQEAFLLAFRSLDDFQGGSALGTWLHRITVNACLGRLRSERRRPTPAGGRGGLAEAGRHASPVRDRPEPPDAALTRAEARAAVRRGLERLPERHRRVLQLRDIDGRTTQEAARLLGTSADAVKTRLHRARQALRAVLEPAVLGTEGGP